VAGRDTEHPDTVRHAVPGLRRLPTNGAVTFVGDDVRCYRLLEFLWKFGRLAVMGHDVRGHDVRLNPVAWLW
jgi:chromosome condensin MukBEF MukE localization factor